MKFILTLTICGIIIILLTTAFVAYLNWSSHHTYNWERKDHFSGYGSMRFIIFEDGKTIRYVDTVNFAVLRNFKRIDSIVIMEIK